MSPHKKVDRLYVVGSGSGGDILPLLELARRWKMECPALSVTLICSSKPIDRTVSEQSSVVDERHYVSYIRSPAKKIWHYPGFFVKALLIAVHAMRILVGSRRRAILITSGGLVSCIVSVVAWMLRMPIQLYELNAVPGSGARFIARIAQQIYVTYEQARGHPLFRAATGIAYPVRFSLKDQILSRTHAIAGATRLSGVVFEETKKTILLIGGSQGSRFLSELLTGWLERTGYATGELQCMHQSSSLEVAWWRAWYAERNILAWVFSFVEELAPLYRSADVVISRAGAGTLAELVFFDAKAIIIPLELGHTTHQWVNAQVTSSEHANRLVVYQEVVLGHYFELFDMTLRCLLSKDRYHGLMYSAQRLGCA